MKKSFPKASLDEIEALCRTLEDATGDWLTANGFGGGSCFGGWNIYRAICDAVEIEYIASKKYSGLIAYQLSDPVFDRKREAK